MTTGTETPSLFVFVDFGFEWRECGTAGAVFFYPNTSNAPMAFRISESILSRP